MGVFDDAASKKIISLITSINDTAEGVLVEEEKLNEYL
jgi:hypothetical protein